MGDTAAAPRMIDTFTHGTAPFLQLIRLILGIDALEGFPDTVSRSIDQFISKHPTLTSHQLQFLDLLRDYIIHRGGVESRDLIQAPFTVVHPGGVCGIFLSVEINEILRLTQGLAV
jgi:type I restriction enzyme R subunit